MPTKLEHQFCDGKELKRCCICKAWFELSCFSLSKRNWDKLNRTCKACASKTNHEWVLKNRERQRKRVMAWRKKNPKKARRLGNEAQKRRRLAAPEYCQAYDKKFREQPKQKLHTAISAGVRRSLHNKMAGLSTKNEISWTTLLGYNVNDLMNHLEGLFQDGFTFNNYGKVWEIDHIVPVAVHNFDSPFDTDFQRCWALKNLQPLRITENRQKSSKLYKHFQPTLF